MLRLVQKETQQNGELLRRILSLSWMSRQHPGEDMESVGLPPSSTVASGPSFLFVPHVFFKMKVKEREVAQSCLTLCDPMDFSLPGSSTHGIFPGENTVVGCRALLQRDLPDPGIKPRSPTL